VSYLPQPVLVVVVLLAHTNKLKYPKLYVFSEDTPGKCKKCQDQIPAEFNPEI
jgi:hypothetical protein